MDLLRFNLIMLAFYFPSLILHEYGHALVGRLIGLRLKSVSIGKGEPFLRIGHFSVAKKQIWEGLYQPYPPTVPLRRGQRAALLFGGIFANFIAGTFVAGSKSALSKSSHASVGSTIYTDIHHFHFI